MLHMNIFIILAKIITHFTQNEITQGTWYLKMENMSPCLIFFPQEQNDN